MTFLAKRHKINVIKDHIRSSDLQIHQFDPFRHLHGSRLIMHGCSICSVDHLH